MVLWIVLAAILLLLLLVLLNLVGLGGRLKRLEQRLASRSSPQAGPSATATSAARAERRRLFDRYLDEDPARRLLPKKEQFAGFRHWRNERGLNWPADGVED